MTKTFSETTLVTTVFDCSSSFEDEAIKREIYKRIFDLFKNFEGTLKELVEKYGIDAKGLVYKSDLSKRIMDVVDGKMSMADAKEWLKGFVATAYNMWRNKKSK